MSKTYYDIALNEYKYLSYHLGISSEMNNPTAALCQQVTEKMLKHVLAELDNTAQELRIHNLKKINAAIKRYNLDLKINDFELAYLTDFNYDARYPGDDYIDVSDEDLQKCIDIMEAIKAKVEAYLKIKDNTKVNSADIITEALELSNKHNVSSPIWKKYCELYKITDEEAELKRLQEMYKTSDASTVLSFLSKDFLT